jgi:hypothetical protein
MRSDKGNNLFLDNVVVEGTVSNRSLDKLNSIKVDLFPNPTNESSTILISNPQGKDIKVDLLDLLGRKINQNDLGGSDSEISLETKNVFGEIQKGIYLINVKSDLGSQTLKWIKQ